MNSSDLWNKSLDILSRREHSTLELKTKLKKFNPDPEDLGDVVARLAILITNVDAHKTQYDERGKDFM